MADLKFQIPQEFMTAVNKFTRSVNKFDNTTKQFQAQMRRRLMTTRRPHHHDPIISQLRRLVQVSERLESNLSRTVDMMSRQTGLGRFLNFSQIEGIIARIPTNMIESMPFTAGAVRFAGAFLGPIGVIASVAFEVTIKLVLKTATYSRQIAAEYYKSLGLTDIAGWRAFSTTFGPYGISLGGMTRALYDISSPESVALRVFRINESDSADAMTAQLEAASNYLKALPPGIVLQMAEGMGLAPLFDEQTILALRTMSRAEIRRLAELYVKRKKMFKLPPETIQKFLDFHWSLETASLKIGIQIIKLLTKGDPSIVSSLEHLGEIFTKITVNVIKVLARLTTPIIMKLIEAFKFVIRKIHSYIGASRKPEQVLFRPGVGPRAKAHIPGPMFRPGVGPRAREAQRLGPLFRPSVGPRARAVERIRERERATTGARERGGAIPEVPTRLRAPTKPSEAPETVQEAVKGGYARPDGGIDRSQFVKELQDKPWLRQRAAEIAAAEEGTHPQGTQMIIESAMNRAQVHGTTLERQLKWTSEGGYYDAAGRRRGEATAADPKSRAVLDKSLNNALGGSNAAENATDNASGDFAERRKQSGQYTFIKKSPAGDYFFSPGTAEPGAIKKYEAWKKGLKPGGGVIPWTVKDIQEMDKDDRTPSAVQPSPGAAMPGAKLSPSGGDPTAVIIHHTGDRHTAERNVDIWRSGGRGIGAQYIVDRDGTIHDVEKEFGYKGTGHIHPDYTPQEFKNKGIVNKNVVGFEVTGTGDKDITPEQVKAVKDFVKKNYPNTPVYGHGEVNPGHREKDEGMTIVNAIRADREANPSAQKVPAEPISGQKEQIASGKLGALPDQADRPYKISGKVTIGNETFDYASGGMKRGSMPYGNYPINIGKGDIGPIGQRIGSVATVGGLGGEIDDPKYPGNPRAGIQIHPWDSATLDQLKSEGCFTVPSSQWPAFKASLLKKAEQGSLIVSIQRNGRAKILTREEFEKNAKASAAAEAEKPKDKNPSQTQHDKPFSWPENSANKKSILYTGKKGDEDKPKNKIKVDNDNSESTVHVQESPTADLSTAPL